MKFKIGQEVVCTADGWYKQKTSTFLFITWTTLKSQPYAPKKNDIVTVAGYWGRVDGRDYIYLNEFPCPVNGVRQAFDESAFQPVVPMSEIEKLFEKTTTHV